MSEIDFDPTSSDARRERSERAVFARLDAMRVAGHLAPVIRPRRTGWLAAGGALAAAAVVIVILLARGHDQVSAPAPAPSLVVTPVGGSSRFTVGDSVIEAGGDTSVEIARATDGGTTLVLARGSIDCEVAPRGNRPPFRVLAGEVTVEVVGTRFSVKRTGGVVRVDVTRGKVRVQAAGEQQLVEAGGSWTSGSVAAAEPVPAEPAAEPRAPEAAPVAAHAKPAGPTAKESWHAAQKLEASQPAEAARGYRAVANGKGIYAGVALYSLAELHAKQDPAAALADVDELARRFPHNRNAEDAAWLRIGVLRRMHRTDDARRAAAAYLREYPSGTYVEQAAPVASP